MELKHKCRLTISTHGCSQQSFHETSEQAEAVMDAFAEQLAKIREWGNRDEDPIFRYKGSGACYVVDLRKAVGASIEYRETWQPVAVEQSLFDLKTVADLKTEANTNGLTDAFERQAPLLR